MEIYNADGSNPKMCGNGLRCLAKYLFDRGLIENKGIVETACGPFRVALRENLIEVEMPTPKLLARDLKITYGNHHFSGHHILVGVPHFVIKSCPIPFVEAAPHLRSHPYFGAEGTNVTFIQGSLTQTFERGVEAITGACGTGTVASFKALQLEEPKIHQKSFTTHSKEILEVKRVEDRFFLNGGVTLLFDAEF